MARKNNRKANSKTGRKSCKCMLILFTLPIIIIAITAINSHLGFAYDTYPYINEIMYNPYGYDNNLEYIEVFFKDNSCNSDACNNNSIDGWIIADATSNDTLQVLSFKNSSYAIIVEEGYNFSYCNCSVYSAGSTIGNNLNNDADSIYLYDKNKTLVAFAAYNSTYANDNNRSLEYYNGSWYESLLFGGTPCSVNSIKLFFENKSFPDISENTTLNESINSTIDGCVNNTIDENVANSSDIDDYIYINNTNVTDNISTADDTNDTNITNDTGIIDETGGIGEINDSNSTDNFYNSSDNYDDNYDNNSCRCNVTIFINTDKVIYISSEKIEYQILLSNSSFSYVIEYWIEDIFGNIAKARYNTTNTNKKSWTPDISEPEKSFIIKARIAELNCTAASGNIGNSTNYCISSNNNDYGNNNASKVVVVAGDNQSSESYVRIKEGTEISAMFGGTLNIDAEIYKGDSTKYSVSAYVEDMSGIKVSEITKVNVYRKYTNTTVTIPIKIKPDCSDERLDGYYKMIISGLDKEDSRIILLNGRASGSCIEKMVYKYEKAVDTALKMQSCIPVSGSTSNISSKSCKEEKTPKIKSFYTLSEKYNPVINLFAAVDNPNNSTQLVLILHDKNYENKIHVNSSSSKIKLPVNVAKSKNLFVLVLLDGNKTIDINYIAVDFSDKNDTTISPFFSGDNIPGSIGSNGRNFSVSGSYYADFTDKKESIHGITAYAVNSLPYIDSETDIILQDSQMNQNKSEEDTGILYQSVSEKSKKVLLFLFIPILIISGAIIFWKNSAA